MNMNIKNEKTMLALIVVAALAMVSVAGVALASESDAGIIVDTDKTTVDADGYEGAISVVAGSKLIIEGNYTGTITFYTKDTGSTVLSTIDCTDVSGVTFVNGGSSIEDSIAVKVYGETTGTIELTKGTVTLGVSADMEAFTGILTVGEYGTIDSGCTYGAVITIVPASGTVAEYVSFSGTNIEAVGDFESAYHGITNEMLGNDIEITQEIVGDTPNKYISGTLAKIDVDGASAIGTYLKTEYGLTEDVYGIICSGKFYAATVVDGKVTDIDDLAYDFSGLTLSDSAASEPGVSGLTGALTINLDATVGTETVLAANSTIVNNGTLTIAGATVTIDGVFINNGDMQITEATSGAGDGSIINYGTFTATSATQWFSEVEVSGYYVQVKATDGKYTTTGYATLADAVAAATGTDDMIVAGGYNYCSEDVTVASTQKIYFAGSNALFALDGEGSLTIAGTATNLSEVPMIIASEASMDLSAATIAQVPAFEAAIIDVNGFIVVKTSLLTPDSSIITGFGTITADTSVTDTTAGTTTFNNLYIALTTTTTGTITLLNNATLNKSATLADGVVFDNKGKNLTIAEGVTMTCDGHFQMTGTNVIKLEVIGTLVINDSTEIVIATPAGSPNTPAGSFVGNVNFILTGTLQVSEGAVFESVVSISAASTKGDIIVDGALTLDAGANVDEVTVSSTGAITFTETSNTTTVTTMTVAGTITNGAENTITVTTMTVTGTFDNTAGKVVVSTLVMTDGTLTAGSNFTVNVKATFGAEGAALTAGDVVNTITIGLKAYVLAYGDFDMSALLGTDGSTVGSTVFYLGDDVFATEYAIKSDGVSLDLLEVNVEGKKLVGWYTSPDFSGSMITANTTGANIGNDGYIAVYGYLVDKTVEVALSFIQNGTWLVDGQSFGSSGTVTLTYGTYTIQVVADNGYELSDYVVTVDGKTVGDDFKFTIDDDSAITAEYTGKIKEKSESGGLDLITILLIIITIVIVIMAIIIALKLMRS